MKPTSAILRSPSTPDSSDAFHTSTRWRSLLSLEKLWWQHIDISQGELTFWAVQAWLVMAASKFAGILHVPMLREIWFEPWGRTSLLLC